MGTWGHNPLDNDEADDLLEHFNESKNISILENALDAVCDLKDSDYSEAPESERAVAAAKIIQDLKDGQIQSEDKSRLLGKIDRALKRILDNSELKELWEESSEYGEWLKSVEELRTHGWGNELVRSIEQKDHISDVTKKNSIFKKSETKEAARKMILHCSKVLFILAAVQIVFGFALTGTFSVIIGVLFGAIALALQHLQSRFAALALLVFSILNVGLVIWGLIFSVRTGNIIIGVAFVIMGIQAVQATSAFHEFSKEEKIST